VSRLEPDQAEEAKRAVHVAMWPARDGPRIFRNQTQFILGRRLEWRYADVWPIPRSTTVSKRKSPPRSGAM